jgi:hypothetical protein
MQPPSLVAREGEGWGADHGTCEGGTRGHRWEMRGVVCKIGRHGSLVGRLCFLFFSFFFLFHRVGFNHLGKREYTHQEMATGGKPGDGKNTPVTRPTTLLGSKKPPATHVGNRYP